MALGHNIKKTFNGGNSLKLQKYESLTTNSEDKGTDFSNSLNGESQKSNSMTSKIIEARMLTGTLSL